MAQQKFYTSNILVVQDLETIDDKFAEFLASLVSKSRQHKSSQHKIQWLGDLQESFGIEEVRLLQEQLAYGKPVTEEWWYLIRNGDNLSIPSQNALLKILEEPPAQTHLCIVTTKPELLLPTIISRCITVNLFSTSEEQKETASQNQLKQIQNSSIAELIDLASQLKIRDDVQVLFSNLQNQIYQQLKTSPNQPNLLKALKHIQTALELLQTNVNLRILTEQTLIKIKQNV